MSEPGLGAVVALVGPPGAGKSTMSARWATVGDVAVFRLREFARSCRAAGWLAENVFTTSDPLGWYSDDTVDALLGEAFVASRFPARAVTVCENFPGSAAQLHALARVGHLRGVPVMAVELDADDVVLGARVTARRVCRVCEPGGGEAHRPAAPDPVDPDRCRRCGHRLERRRTDAQHLFALRLGRYRSRLPAIRAAAGQAGIGWQRIDTASLDPIAALDLVRADIRPRPMPPSGVLVPGQPLMSGRSVEPHLIASRCTPREGA